MLEASKRKKETKRERERMNVDVAPPLLLQDWDDDDREMVQFLLLGGPSSGVDYACDNDDGHYQQHHQQQQQFDKQKKANSSKAKLSAMERREKHREVVRRSYHRNKAVLTGLRDTVKELEDEMKSLAVEKRRKEEESEQENEQQSQALIQMTTQSDGKRSPEGLRLEELKRQCDELAAQSQVLEGESAHLRETLKTHGQFVQAVCTASEETASEEDDDDSDGCFSVDEQLSSPWRSPAFPETSDEDFSPDKRKKTKFYPSPRPVHAPTLAPRAPLSTELWKDIGFKHLSLSTARTLVNETYQSILNFSLSGRAMSTGAHVMGWEDKRLMDGTAIKFSLRKQFVGEKASELMAKTWMCFSDPVCADEKFRGLLTLRILQHVNDDAIVALRDTVSPDNSTVFRCVYLLFRVRTRSGFIICSRSIGHACVGAKERTTRTKDGKVIHWVNLFGWFVFDQLGYADHSSSLFYETGAQVEYGGSMNYGDASHLPALAMDTLSVVSRWEGFMIPPVFALPRSF